MSALLIFAGCLFVILLAVYFTFTDSLNSIDATLEQIDVERESREFRDNGGADK